jgi:hypothetical protein
MTNAMKFLAGTIGAAAAITGLAMAKPEPAQADVEDRQSQRYERRYCTSSEACR